MAKSSKVISGPAPFDDSKYRCEDALRTLTRAEEIKKDTSLMRDVRAFAKKQVATTQAVVGSPRPSGKRK